MPVYQNNPENFKNIKKYLQFNQLVVLLSMVIGIACISFSSGPQDSYKFYTTIGVLLLVIIVMIRAFSKVMAQYKLKYLNYRLTITDDYLQTDGNGNLATTIYFDSITRVTENWRGDLLVKGEKMPYIFISSQLINFDIVKALVKEKHTIRAGGAFERYGMLLVTLTIGCMAGLYISDNKIVVSICGVILLTTLGWSTYITQTSPLIDERTRKSSRWVFVVVIAVITILYQKILGHNIA